VKEKDLYKYFEFSEFTLKQKVTFSMVGYSYCLSKSRFVRAKEHLSKAIEYSLNKIKKEHC